MSGTTWTPDEVAVLERMMAAGAKSNEIADALPGRTQGSVAAKIGYVTNRRVRGRGRPPDGGSSLITPREAEQRDRLLRARLAQCPLAAMMGDPPPGFSALDRRR